MDNLTQNEGLWQQKSARAIELHFGLHLMRKGYSTAGRRLPADAGHRPALIKRQKDGIWLAAVT